MADQPHVENCPGCVADLLTEEDREYLRATGWIHPRHVFVPPPLMPPPPVQVFDVEPAIWWLPFIGVGLLGFEAMRWWWVGATVVWIAILVLLRDRHFVRHRASRSQSCFWCRQTERREGEHMWARYRELTAQEEARWHAANYQRLLDQEERYQSPD